MKPFLIIPGTIIKFPLIAGLLIIVSLSVYPDTTKIESGLISICAIQGSGFHSPKEGDRVRTRGVVHGDLDNRSRRGFFMQDENCDGNSSTSDGIFVYLGDNVDVVGSGDMVEVVGTVQEYFGLTELVTTPGDVKVLSTGNPLPVPVELKPPFSDKESSKYFERLEGMRVCMDEAVTVGPTDAEDRSWLVHADLGVQRVFHDDPRGTGEIVCVDDGGTHWIDPEVKVGDRVEGLLGTQDYKGGEFCLQLFAQPSVLPASQSPETEFVIDFASSPVIQLQIGTFNLANLFDTIDDPNTEDSVLSASEYQRRLNKRALAIHETLGEPEIIALQEAENQEVLQALILRPEIEAEYGIVWQDGPDFRGIDVALLYRTDRVNLIDYEVRQGCTDMIDGLGPDGNRDVYNPINAVTCDTNGDGYLDGNRLFSRPPLVVRLTLCEGDCGATGEGVVDGDADIELFHVIVNHWKSKLQDSEITEYTLPRRIEQATHVREIVDEILAADLQANLVVLGDLNDHSQSQPLAILEDRLNNQFFRVPASERYTYIYRGRSQVLDHILVRMKPGLAAVVFQALHINADYPVVFVGVGDSVYRSSDHDLLLTGFMSLDVVNNLPLVLR